MNEMDASLKTYKTVDQIANVMCMCKTTVRNRIKEMIDEKDAGTYPDWVLIQDGKMLRCWLPAFIHYENERSWLRDVNDRRYAKPFNERR